MGLNKLASPIIGVLLILSALSISPQFNVLAQEGSLPALFALGSPDTVTKEVPLKGIRQNGEITKVSDYKIDFNNVIQIGQGQNLVLFPEPSTDEFAVTKAKLLNEQKQAINLVPVSGQQNTFSLNGIPNGVYTLQVVGSLGNTEGGYETVLVVPVLTEEIRKVVQDRINQILLVEIYVEIIFEEPGPSPCYFDPSLEECKPIGGRCPDGFGFNDDEQCIPHGQCPNGYGRLDDDETGTCYKKSDIKTCPDGYITHRNQECPPPFPTPAPVIDPIGPDPTYGTPTPEIIPEDENIKRSQDCYARGDPGSCLDVSEEEDIVTTEEDEADEDDQPAEQPSDGEDDNGDDNSGGGGDETSQEGSDE